jgi:hypothetical protein
MSLKPISMRTTLPPLILFNNQNNKQKDNQNQPYELIETSITVRENEEFFINCAVESSKPAADIYFSMSNGAGGNQIAGASGIITFNSLSELKDNEEDDENGYSPALTSLYSGLSQQTTTTRQPNSLISSSSNVAKNSDRTFKTVHTSHLKVSSDDHGKVITCKAENGFSNQKWENKKLLNVLCNYYFLILKINISLIEFLRSYIYYM